MGFNALAEGTFFDDGVHILTGAVALSLFLVSLRAYLKLKKPKFLYLCLAFFLYAIKEVIVVLDVFFLRNPIATAVSHVLNLVVLLLFFAGVVK